MLNFITILAAEEETCEYPAAEPDEKLKWLKDLICGLGITNPISLF